MNRNRIKKSDLLIAASLLAGYFAVLLLTADGVGFVRDEGYYFKAAEDYNGWFVNLWENVKSGRPFDSFRQDNIDRYFSYNHEHPALMKELFGFSWQIFHNGLNIMRNSTAFRLPGMFFGGLALALIYLFGVKIRNRRTGLFAAAALATIPRFFFHGHLACFDVPITAMTLFTVFAFLLSEENRTWGWLTGLIFGLALAVKHNAYFIPFALILYWIYRDWNEFKILNEKGKADFKIPVIPTAFIAMLIIGPAILIGHWPWLWPAVGERLGAYFNFHLQHEHYPVSYFNEVFYLPPFPKEFVFVMTAITVPFTTFLVASIGFFRGVIIIVNGWIDKLLKIHMPDANPDEKNIMFLLVLNALYPMLIFVLPGTPIFGGVKHWFPAMPFLCLLGALEFDTLLASLASTLKKLFTSKLVPWFAGALIILPSILGNFYIHPYGTGFYNEIERGTRGAGDDEMQRKFWGYASRGVLDWINKNAEPYSRVCFHRTNWDSYNMYIRDGLLRPDIRYSGDPSDADYLVFHYQKAFLETEYKAWLYFGNEKALTGVYIDEAPFVQVFKRNRR